jgi:hypothetical protein
MSTPHTYRISLAGERGETDGRHRAVLPEATQKKNVLYIWQLRTSPVN